MGRVIKTKDYRLLHGDCLKIMPKIPDAYFDLVLTDPLYNISRDDGNFESMGRSGIDFGMWDKGFDLFSYIDEVYRVLNENGSFIVFNDWKNLGDISKYSEQLGFETKDMIRLEKLNPMPRNRNRRYVVDYECGVWFTMPKSKWVFNRQDSQYQRPKFVHSIDKGRHPTQKSLGLMNALLMIHSNKGDRVFDPFMGSGTTGVACIKTKRRFVGIEMDEKYFNTSAKRIKAAENNKGFDL